MHSEHVDVLVIGAGISGISAGYHLQAECPDRTYAILEARDAIGGTWDLFRYPGVRSDSDMHTLAFGFRPWTGDRAIADGPSILAYVRDTAAELGIDRRIRFGHRATRAEWSTDAATWTVHVDRADGPPTTLTCSFLFVCAGYYRYEAGHTPPLPGLDRFDGPVVHPQRWPEDLQVAGRRVVVVGSGATAMTLVPALAETAGHVTMVQRSPTWVVARPTRDPLARAAHRLLPRRWADRLIRRKNIALGELFYNQTRTRPQRIRQKLLDAIRRELGPDYDVDRHFTPSYDPWDQRLCLLPDGDLFAAIRAGRASVVTDRIETFTDHGVTLVSGRELEADVVVTATGLDVVTLGEMEVVVDGRPVDLSETWTYKGIAYSDVPNLVSTFGYINASWTLRADLISQYVCRLLDHLTATGTTTCTPRLRPSDAGMAERPWIDGFSSGYLRRVLPRLPRQGDRAPWLNPQRYSPDRRQLVADVDDGVMRFTGTGRAAPAVPVGEDGKSDAVHTSG